MKYLDLIREIQFYLLFWLSSVTKKYLHNWSKMYDLDFRSTVTGTTYMSVKDSIEKSKSYLSKIFHREKNSVMKIEHSHIFSFLYLFFSLQNSFIFNFSHIPTLIIEYISLNFKQIFYKLCYLALLFTC